jgi:hypothetical protein
MNALVLAIVVTAVVWQPGDIQTIAKDSMSNVEDAGQAVAFTQDEWGLIWRKHAFDKPLPKVDFATRNVIAIFLGSRPTAGYDIEILGTEQDGDAVIVEWAEVRPRERLLLAQVLTSPALIASIPKTAGATSVGFRKVTR